MKKRNLKQVRFPRIPIAPCGGAFLYLLLMVSCAVFTQALRSSISAMILVFVLLLPLADVICLVVSWFFVSVDVEGTNRVMTRGECVTIPIRMTNDSVIPVSCVEATLSMPAQYALRSKTVAKHVTLPPFSTSTTNIRVGFDCRGYFVIGVEEIFLFDYLRLIRIRKRVGRHVRIRVLPKLLAPLGGLPPFDNSGISRQDSWEQSRMTEYGDIREYRPGDGIKSIHWKLSTKMEELQVRKLTSESEKNLLLYADFSIAPTAWNFSDELSLIVSNRIAEESLSAACEAAASGAGGKLVWFHRDGVPVISLFSNRKTAENLAYPLSEAEGGTGHFPRDLVVGSSVSTLYVAAYLSPEIEDTLYRIAADCAGAPCAARLLALDGLLEDEERKEYRKSLEDLRLRLSENGIPVTISYREEGEA